MRVTNNMMRNNSLMNMQKNKVAYNKYLTEYNTQKKIQRPSDDPTVAVRALKYRTTLVEIDQYLTNIKDATAWMDATETALKDINGRLTEMITYCTQAATGTVNADDRKNIVTQLKQYSEYIYEQNANTDYAGRYIFTGYRTDVPMLFEEPQENVTYTITENLDVNNIRKYQYVYGQAQYDDTKVAEDYANEASEFATTHRIMMSYDECDATDVTLSYIDAEGNKKTLTAVTKSVTEDTTFNEHLHPEASEVYFVPETGELVFGDSIYDEIRGGSELSVVYDKTSFEKNDVRPEHYFNCNSIDNGTGVESRYGNAGSQTMNYQINFSQTLTVNTEGVNAIDLNVGRTIDDIINLCNDLDVMEEYLTSVEKRISDCDEGDEETLANLNELKSQVETQIELEKSVLVKAVSGAITVCQDAKDELNVALADHGSRYARMNMTKTKLEQQEMDTEEAKSDNEDADLGEAYINFSEADLLYQATLGATSKILGESLLNFI